jgi:hypothetical protein
MELTEEQKGHIRHWAGLMLEPTQIANIMQLPVAEFVLQAGKKGTAIHTLMQEGVDVQIAKVREATFKAAEHGSSPAIAQVNRLILEHKLKRPRQ